MNVFIGGRAPSDKHGLDNTVLDEWGLSIEHQLDALQDSNKFWRENQVGWGKKPGQSSLCEVEARIPSRLMHVYLKAHPDLDINDDRQWYKFLDAHPEIDVRKERPNLRKG